MFFVFYNRVFVLCRERFATPPYPKILEIDVFKKYLIAIVGPPYVHVRVEGVGQDRSSGNSAHLILVVIHILEGYVVILELLVEHLVLSWSS